MRPGQVNDGPRLVTNGLMAKVSTDGSDENDPQPGSTLSYLIVSFHPFWPEVDNLALNLSTVRSMFAQNRPGLLSIR